MVVDGVDVGEQARKFPQQELGRLRRRHAGGYCETDRCYVEIFEPCLFDNEKSECRHSRSKSVPRIGHDDFILLKFLTPQPYIGRLRRIGFGDGARDLAFPVPGGFPLVAFWLGLTSLGTYRAAALSALDVFLFLKFDGCLFALRLFEHENGADSAQTDGNENSNTDDYYPADLHNLV